MGPINQSAGNIKGGSVPLTSCIDWFGLVCFAIKNKNCQLSYSWFQTSQTGGQWYSDTSPFSIPWRVLPYTRLKRLFSDEHSSLFVTLLSCEENEVLWIYPLTDILTLRESSVGASSIQLHYDLLISLSYWHFLSYSISQCISCSSWTQTLYLRIMLRAFTIMLFSTFLTGHSKGINEVLVYLWSQMLI